MGLFSRIGSTVAGAVGGIFGRSRKRGSSSDDAPPPGMKYVEEAKIRAIDAADVQKQVRVQAAEAEAQRAKGQRAQRYKPGFFSSYTHWAAWRTRQKIKGTIPKDFPLTVQQYEQEMAKLQAEIAKKKMLESVPQPRTPQQRRPGQRLPGYGTSVSQGPQTELEKFLAGILWIETPQSSNVSKIAYDPEHATLKVIFHDENEYHYLSVSADEATAFYHAGSKGGWVWDELRIRGTALGHKKRYIHVAGHGDIQRKWIQTQQSMVAHLNQVDDESQGAGQGKAAMIPDSVPYEFFLEGPPIIPPGK